MGAYALGQMLVTIVLIVAFFLVVRLTPFFWGVEVSPRRAAAPPRAEGQPREASHPA